MKSPRTPDNEEPAAERACDFRPVDKGFTEEMALAEAERCLNCKKPFCVEGCPVNINIPRFIEQIRAKDFGGALDTIREDSMLPAICGRVCPQENQCEGKCIRGKKSEPVAIGQLERFLGDRPELASTPKMAPKNGKKVAVVGSGPSGLTCAGELARNGFDVTVFEAFFTGGGVLVYGIPEFRLPKAVVKREIDGLEDMGVKFEYNSVVGNMATAEELFEQGFDAIYVATGAGLPKFLNVPGENLPNVFFANEYLTRVNLMKANKFPEYDTPTKHGKNVVVFGGGNVAMDAVRTAKRLGAEHAIIAYRRTEDEMPCCTMLRPRASRFCRSSPRSSLSLARTAPCAPSRSRRWSSASPTSPAVVARCPSRAPSRRFPATSQSRLSVPTPTPSQRRSAARWSSTSGATSSPTRRPARPPIPASGPAATSSPVPLRSFWRWAPARRPPLPSPRACWASNHPQR